LPLALPQKRLKARTITKEERERNVAGLLRKALTDGKLVGVREKRSKEKAEKTAAGLKKEAKAGGAEEAAGDD